MFDNLVPKHLFLKLIDIYLLSLFIIPFRLYQLLFGFIATMIIKDLFYKFEH